MISGDGALTVCGDEMGEIAKWWIDAYGATGVALTSAELDAPPPAYTAADTTWVVLRHYHRRVVVKLVAGRALNQGVMTTTDRRPLHFVAGRFGCVPSQFHDRVKPPTALNPDGAEGKPTNSRVGEGAEVKGADGIRG